MKWQFSVVALIGWTVITPVALSAQDSDQAPGPAVMQAVRAALIPSAGTSLPGKASSGNPDMCAAVFSRNADGTPDLVAGSYNEFHRKIAMLHYKQGSADIVDALTDRELFLGGEFCDVSVINLADPTDPSSLLAKTVEFSLSGQDWYLVWDGTRFRNITALDYEKNTRLPLSSMSDSYVVDLDHRGAMQIAGNNEDWDKFPDDDGIASTGTKTLFRYNGTTYAPARTFLYLENYEPNLPKTAEQKAFYKGDMAPWTSYIAMHKIPAPSYQLKIVNGDRDGSNRVTSAKIEINGQPVLAASEVNQAVETLTRTIQLQKQNKIKVTVDGPAKSHMYVTIE